MEYISGETLWNTDSSKVLGATEKYEHK